MTNITDNAPIGGGGGGPCGNDEYLDGGTNCISNYLIFIFLECETKIFGCNMC